jgi:hypothetical protein
MEDKEPHWIDRGSFWQSTAPQQSTQWREDREGRLTGYLFGAATGHDPSKSREIAKDIYQGKITIEHNKLMEDGIIREPIARQWYSEEKKVSVREVGLAVPKWDIRLGSSLDGEIIDETGEPIGNLEIKCPARMYPSLLRYTIQVSQGWVPPSGYHGHIYSSHYDQMQGGMAITNRPWCDYVVFSVSDQKVFVQRILFDREYWGQGLYPGLDQFLNEVGVLKQEAPIEVPWNLRRLNSREK